MICNLGIHKRYKNFYLSVSIYNQKDEIIEVYDVAYYDIETSVYYCKSRYYVPEWGRFLTPDSFEYLDPTSIIGLKLFAYCSNDPVNTNDRILEFAQRGHQGNMRKSKYAYWTTEELLERYNELSHKGHLTAKEKEEKKEIETELKARGEKNKSKRKGYNHSHISNTFNFDVFSNSLDFEKIGYKKNINSSLEVMGDIIGISAIIAYVLANDTTGIGILDDVTLLILFPIFILLRRK